MQGSFGHLVVLIVVSYKIPSGRESLNNPCKKVQRKPFFEPAL